MKVKKVQFMKVTQYKKLSFVISLWLLAIMATLIVFGYQLEMYGFYIASAVVAVPLLFTNIFNLVNGLIHSRSKAIAAKREYN